MIELGSGLIPSSGAPEVSRQRWRRGFGVAAALTVLHLGLVGLWSSARASIPGEPCESADFLIDEGELDAARTILEEVIPDRDNRSCAIQGLEVIDRLEKGAPDPLPADDPCASAHALMETNRKVEAEETYIELLATPSAVPCATQALQAIPPGQSSDIPSAMWYWVKRYWLWALGLVGLVLVVRRIRRPQLVMIDPKDGSGDDELGKQLAGFGQQSREGLTHELRRRRRKYLESRKRQRSGGTTLEHAPVVPLPSGAISTTAADIVSGLKDVQGVGSIVPFVSVLFRPRGVQASSVILKTNATRRLGLAYELTDIDGKQPGTAFTCWVDLGTSSWKASERLLAIASRRLGIELLKRREYSSSRLRWRLRAVDREVREGIMSRLLARTYRKKAREQAGWFHNYIGKLDLWSGIEFFDELSFYDEALKELSAAVDRLDAYQPQENLADTYRFKARSLDGSDQRGLLDQAAGWYRRAARSAQQLAGPDGRTVQTRLTVSEATALLLIDEATEVGQAIDLVSQLIGQDPLSFLKDADQATVYNLASFWALLDRSRRDRSRALTSTGVAAKLEELPSPQHSALRYLGFWMLVGPEPPSWDVRRDPDVADLPGIDGLSDQAARATAAKVAGDVPNDDERRQQLWIEAELIATVAEGGTDG